MTIKLVRRHVLRFLGLASAALLIASAPLAHAAGKGKSADQAAAEKAVEKFLATIEEGFRTRNAEMLSSPEIYYAGDDTPDAVVMPFVGFAVAVADAHDAVKAAAHYVTQRRGGRGAVREVIDLLFAAKS